MRVARRLILLFVGAVAFLAAVLSVSTVQTRLANAYFARQKIPLTIQQLTLGWNRFEAYEVRYRQSGGELAIPRAEGHLDLWALLHGKIRMDRCLITDLAYDLSTALPEGDSPPVLPTPDSVRFGIEAIQNWLVLPLPIEIKDFQGDGALRLRSGNTAEAKSTEMYFRAKGALLPRQTSRLDVQFVARAPDALGGWVEVEARNVLSLHLQDEQRLDQLTLNGSFSATGPRFPNGAVLGYRIELATESKGLAIDAQAYGVGDSDRRELLNIRAGTDQSSGSVKGRWMVDLNQSDLTPYLLGRTLPTFSWKGNGGFVLADGLRIAGEWEADLPSLALIDPRFAALGECRIRGVIDAQRLENRWRIHRATSRVTSGSTVVALQLMQTVEFNRVSQAWSVANPEGEVFGAEWQNLPLAVVRPWLGDWPVDGLMEQGGVTGRFSASGWVLRSLRPQWIKSARWRPPGGLPSNPVELRFDYEAVLGKKSWRVEISRFLAQVNEQRLVEASGLVRRAENHSTELTGELDFHLGSLHFLLPNPTAPAELTGGIARSRLAFAVQDGAVWQGQVDLNVSGVTLRQGASLANLSTSARLDRAKTGAWDIELPLEFSDAAGKSDLMVLSHLAEPSPASQWETVVTSRALSLPALLGWWQAYQRVVLATPSPTQANEPISSGPFWNGLRGKLQVALAAVTWPQRTSPLQIEFRGDVSAQQVRIEQAKLVSADGSNADFKGEITLPKTNNSESHYYFAGSGTAREFDPAPYLLFLDPLRAPLVEGKFDVDLSFKGRAKHWEHVVDDTQANLVLTGRGGRFHAFDEVALMADFNRITGAGSRFANLVGKATSLFTNVDKRINAANQFIRRFASLAYDQATFELNIKPGQDVEVREFSLISPELRLVGRGNLQSNASIPLAARALKMSLDVSVRGANERDLRTLGLLDERSDPLGYFPLGRPLKVEGTVRDLAAKNLVELLTTAIEK